MIVDATLLLDRSMPTSPHHERARGWPTASLNCDERVGLPWASLCGFLRIATHPRASAYLLRLRGRGGSRTSAWRSIRRGWRATDRSARGRPRHAGFEDGIAGTLVPGSSSCRAGDRARRGDRVLQREQPTLPRSPRSGGSTRSPGRPGYRCRDANEREHGCGSPGWARQHAHRHARRQHPVRPVGQSGVLRVVVPVPGQLPARLGGARQLDYLYVSHLHRDHFDAGAPEPVSSTRTRPSCCRSTRPASWRTSCASSGSHVPWTAATKCCELDGGLKVMIQALTTPDRRPDRRLVAVGGTTAQRLLNQNDARPTDLTAFAELGHVHAHMLQFSGAIWYPMVYELPQPAKTAFGKQKRDRQFDRTLRYIDDLRASGRLPDRRAAVLPRRGAVAVQRHLRRRGQHLPRPAASSWH